MSKEKLKTDRRKAIVSKMRILTGTSFFPLSDYPFAAFIWNGAGIMGI